MLVVVVRPAFVVALAYGRDTRYRYRADYDRSQALYPLSVSVFFQIVFFVFVSWFKYTIIIVIVKQIL
jgi:hypothetical protein